MCPCGESEKQCDVLDYTTSGPFGLFPFTVEARKLEHHNLPKAMFQLSGVPFMAAGKMRGKGSVRGFAVEAICLYIYIPTLYCDVLYDIV